MNLDRQPLGAADPEAAATGRAAAGQEPHMDADQSERHPENTVKSCRNPALPCDRICLECSGAFDGLDPFPRAVTVSDDEAMEAMLARFGFQPVEKP